MKTVVMQTKDQKHDGEAAKPSEERFDLNALGVDSPRNKGDIVEAKFLAKASSLGFGVARPWATERYDFVLDSGYAFWRVQVKSNRGRADGAYLVKVSGYKRVAYTERDIDFLVAYLVPEDLWYIVPIKKLLGKGTSVLLSPRARHVALGEVSRSLVPDGVSSRRERPQQDRDPALLRQRPNPPADLPPEAVAVKRQKASAPSREAA
jgi:hypothetical protein